MRAAVLLGALVLLAAGCPKKPDPIETGKVRQVWEQSKIDTARFEALILNRGAYESDLSRKYRKIWDGLEIERQIPEKDDLEGLRGALEAHARGLGLTMELELEPLAATGSLPARVGPDEVVPWSEATLLKTTRLALTLRPADLGKLETWFLTRKKLGRSLELKSVKLQRGSARIEALAYAFRTDLPLPRRQQPPFDFAAILKSAGLAGVKVEDHSKLQEAKVRYASLNGKLEEIDEALGLRTEAERLDARYDRFLQVSRRCGAQRWLEVLK